MLLFRIFLFALPLSADPLGVAEDVRAVAMDEAPLVEDDRERSACLFTAWTSKETAGWDATALGDGGSSIGVGQIKPWHAWKIAHIDPALVRTNRRESMRAAWRVMHHEILRCGSVASGLGAYASGQCNGAQAKVHARLLIAAGC